MRTELLKIMDRKKNISVDKLKTGKKNVKKKYFDISLFLHLMVFLIDSSFEN